VGFVQAALPKEPGSDRRTVTDVRDVEQAAGQKLLGVQITRSRYLLQAEHPAAAFAAAANLL
jgi:hypothetical protein